MKPVCPKEFNIHPDMKGECELCRHAHDSCDEGMDYLEGLKEIEKSVASGDGREKWPWHNKEYNKNRTI